MSLLRVGFGGTLISRNRPLDGVGVYAANLYSQLRQRDGIDVHPGSFPPKPWQTASVAPLPQGTLFGSAYGIAAAISTLTGLPFRGSRRIGERIDLFHAPDHLIPKLRGTPVVATICDALPVKRPDWINAGPFHFRSRLMRAAAGWADHVIAISVAMVPDLVQYLRIPEKRISVVHLGIGEEWFEKVPDEERSAVLARYRLEPGYFLFVGTLQPRKNVEAFLSAYESLPAELRAARQLVIAGQAGWGSEATVRRLRSADPSRCVWLDYVPARDLQAVYQGAGAFVFPSLWEGFGIPVLEAFASGVPVVTSNLSSLPEIAGEAALLVDPQSVSQLRDAMARLAGDPDLAAQLVRLGRARARQMSWDECTRKTIDVYRNLV